MDTLHYSAQLLRFTGIYLDENSSRFKEIHSIFGNIFAVGQMLFMIKMLFDYASDDNYELNSRFYSAMIILAITTILLPYIALTLDKKNVTIFFKLIRELTDERNCDWLQLCINGKSDFLFQFAGSGHFSYVKAAKFEGFLAYWPPRINNLLYIAALTIPPAYNLIKDYGRRKLQPDTWYTFFYVKAPVDNSTISGYAILYCIEMIFIFVAGTIFIAVLLTFFNPAIYINAFCQDFRKTFDKIDEMSEELLARNLKKIRNLLIENILFYEKIIRWDEMKRLFTSICNFSFRRVVNVHGSVMSGPIFIVIVSGVVLNSLVMFLMDAVRWTEIPAFFAKK